MIKKDSDSIAYITNQLHLEARNNHEMPKVEELAFSVVDAQQNVIGGIVGYLLYGSLMIDILWVDKNHRGKGYGRKLVLTLENEAISKGAKFATVTSMSFWKALGFYEKMGYELISTQNGFTNGVKQYSLRKKLHTN